MWTKKWITTDNQSPWEFSTKPVYLDTAYNIFREQAIILNFKGFNRIPTNQQASTTIDYL